MKIVTPGRICLFGEHQDYLSLPTIAMAISLYSTINGEKRNDKQVIIHKPDLNEIEKFSIDNLIYTSKRDYLKSGLKICLQEGLKFSNGFNCTIKSIYK